MPDLAQDVEAYAALAATLAAPGCNRAALLSAHGLSEAQWEALDEAWQARMAEDTEQDGQGMPALLAAYAEAFARAQRTAARSILSFDGFLSAVREIRRGADMSTVMERLGVSLSDFMASQEHWTAQMRKDEALAERFRRAVR